MISREEFLANRRKGIGGSDAAAVLGLSKWKTAYDVFLDKTGQSEPTPDNDAMLWGRLLEPVIRQQYADRTGREVAMPSMLTDAKSPYIVANVDGLCDDRVLEIKTARTAKDWGEEGTDEVPMQYFLQCQHYLMVTGKPVADVAVLIGSADFRIYTVEANEKLFGVMRTAYAEFWNGHVLTGTPPEAVSYADAVAQYRQSDGTSIEATPDVVKALDALSDIQTAMKDYERQEELLKGTIMSFMGNHETLTVDGLTRVSWKTSKAAERFDSKAFKAAHPDLAAEFTKPGAPSRRFLIK